MVTNQYDLAKTIAHLVESGLREIVEVRMQTPEGIPNAERLDKALDCFASVLLFALEASQNMPVLLPLPPFVSGDFSTDWELGVAV